MDGSDERSYSYSDLKRFLQGGDFFSLSTKSPAVQDRVVGPLPNGVYKSGQIIATSAEVTPNGGLVRESHQNPLNSGLGIIVICPAFKWRGY